VRQGESDKTVFNRQGPLQLSILIPSNRRGLLVCSRIAQACSWAGPNIEVIIRDNSGDPEKRALLAHFHRDNCHIDSVDPCLPIDNVSDVMRRAQGDYIFLLADDDFCFDQAIATIPALIDKIGDDRAVAGITGAYAIELAQGSAVVDYKQIDSDDPLMRIGGFLQYNGPNIMHYAPVRRAICQRVFEFMRSMPATLSFHDQIVCMLYLLNGKFVPLQRFLYLYEMGPWQHSGSAHARDLAFYKDAGLDPAINVLHWFLCGFEGALLARNSDLFPNLPLGVRQPVADRWFSTMFQRFQHPRSVYDSPFKAEAEALYAKLLTSTGQLSFAGMLAEICGLMALCSTDFAQKYFNFWLAIVNQRPAALLAAAAPPAAQARAIG